MALRSAYECGGTIILAERLELVTPGDSAEARQLLDRIVAMLTVLAERFSDRERERERERERR
jgi:hypothetical protein